MQLNILKGIIADYKADLQQQKAIGLDHFCEIAEHWRQNWDLDAPDFIGMFDQCLHSNISRKLWKNDRGDAKAMLMDLMRLDPEFGRRLFRGLINDEKELSKRISHFHFGCEVLMEEYKNQNRSSNLTDHLHNGPFFPMLYLFFYQPDQYCPYFHSAFTHLMNKVKAFPTYEAPDVERFQKVLKTLRHFLEADPEIVDRFKALAGDWDRELGILLVLDFYRWAGSGKG